MTTDETSGLQRFVPLWYTQPANNTKDEPPIVKDENRWYKCGTGDGTGNIPQCAPNGDDDGDHTAYVSVDVLIATRTSNDDHFYATGWYNYIIKQWQWYGFVSDQTARDGQLTALYWRYLPDPPNGFPFDPYGDTPERGATDV